MNDNSEPASTEAKATGGHCAMRSASTCQGLIWKKRGPAPYSADMTPYILAFGDSLTDGYGLTRTDSFTSQLETLLRERHPLARVDNAGVAGDTTTSARAGAPSSCRFG